MKNENYLILYSFFLTHFGMLIEDLAEKCWFMLLMICNWLVFDFFFDFASILCSSWVFWCMLRNSPPSSAPSSSVFCFLYKGGALPRRCWRKWRGRQWRGWSPHIRLDIPLVRRLQVQRCIMRVGVSMPVGVSMHMPMAVGMTDAQWWLPRPQSCWRTAKKGVGIAKIILWRRHHFPGGWKILERKTISSQLTNYDKAVHSWRN